MQVLMVPLMRTLMTTLFPSSGAPAVDNRQLESADNRLTEGNDQRLLESA